MKTCLSKNISGFTNAILVGKHSTHSIGSPYVFGVVAQHLLVHGQGSVLVSLLPVLVSGWLMQGLQPYVAQGDQGICVVLSGRIFKYPLKLLLARTPLHFCQVEICKQRPGVWVLIVDSESFLCNHYSKLIFSSIKVNIVYTLNQSEAS